MTTYYTLNTDGTYSPAESQPRLVPDGYMVVKREPDVEMKLRAHYWRSFAGSYESLLTGIYRAMTQAGELK